MNSRYHISFCIVVLILLLCDLPVAQAQGRLGRVRDTVRNEPVQQNSERNESGSSDERNQRQSRQQQSDRSARVASNPGNQQADGTLSSIRENVRRHDTDRHEQNNGTGDHHEDHGHRGQRSSRRQRRSSFGATFYPGNCGPAYYPTRFSNPCIAPAPVQIYTPPCYEPVFTQHVITRPVVVAPEPAPVVIVTKPAPVVVKEPAPMNVPAPAVEIGQSYFDCTDDFSWWSARITAHYGNDFDGIGQGGLSFLFQNPGGGGLDASVTMLRERGTGWRDHLWIGDANLVYEFTEGEVRSRIGIGVNWLGDRYGGEAGLNLTGSMDWRLSDLTTFTGEVDFGSLADADFLHTRVSLSRAVSGNTELMVGYDYYDIGGTEISSLVTGFTFRF
ncbi:MAG: hypothetical protein AAF456_05080 [Planctomycetota bacterium]